MNNNANVQHQASTALYSKVSSPWFAKSVMHRRSPFMLCSNVRERRVIGDRSDPPYSSSCSLPRWLERSLGLKLRRRSSAASFRAPPPPPPPFLTSTAGDMSAKRHWSICHDLLRSQNFFPLCGPFLFFGRLSKYHALSVLPAVKPYAVTRSHTCMSITAHTNPLVGYSLYTASMFFSAYLMKRGLMGWIFFAIIFHQNVATHATPRARTMGRIHKPLQSSYSKDT